MHQREPHRVPTPHETREGSNPNRAEAFGSPGPVARSSPGAARVSERASEVCGDAAGSAGDTGLARAALGSLPTRRKEPGAWLSVRNTLRAGEGFPGSGLRGLIETSNRAVLSSIF